MSKRNDGVVLWFTGLSGAGKSTLAEALIPRLRAHGRKVELLDGDVVRTHLCKGLGFSREDRDTNIARIAFVAHLLARNGVVVVVAAISPFGERATRRGEPSATLSRFTWLRLLTSASGATSRVCTRRRSPGRSPNLRASAIRTRSRYRQSFASTRARCRSTRGPSEFSRRCRN